jgi:CheY-like chemotaxis protein
MMHEDAAAGTATTRELVATNACATISDVSVSWRWNDTSEAGADDAAAAPLEGLRILVVDDDPDARDLLCALLGQRGAAVSTASRAEDAFEQLITKRPDVLVSDIAMPGEDGYTLVGRVRALPADHGGRTPAIAVTAYAASSDRARALAAGFDHYLSKPVDLDKLVETLRALRGPSLRAV